MGRRTVVDVPYRRADGKMIHLSVDAVECGVPGLAIMRGADGSGHTIVHVPTGFGVGWFPGSVEPEAVLACAFELDALADWTVPLPDAGALSRDVLPVLAHYGAKDYCGPRRPEFYETDEPEAASHA